MLGQRIAQNQTIHAELRNGVPQIATARCEDSDIAVIMGVHNWTEAGRWDLSPENIAKWHVTCVTFFHSQKMVARS